MADISLIPKEYEERKFSFRNIFSKMGFLTSILVVLSLLVYGGLSLYNKSLINQLEKIQSQIGEADKQRDIDFEKKAISLEKALNSLKIVLKSQVYWSNLFSKLEELTVPQVNLSNFNGRTEKNGFVSVTLDGSAAGYTYLAKQMVSFSQEKSISDIGVSGIKLGTEGGIEFVLNINFLKDVLLK